MSDSPGTAPHEYVVRFSGYFVADAGPSCGPGDGFGKPTGYGEIDYLVVAFTAEDALIQVKCLATGRGLQEYKALEVRPRYG